MDEFHRCILGPGLFVIKHGMEPEIAQKALDVLKKVKGSELETKDLVGCTRFQEKHALEEPDTYAEYYSNPLL